MLKDLLEKRQCFKLVCGAGNEDEAEVEKLVTVYSLAGCQFFDVCAKKEIVLAAKRGIKVSKNLDFSKTSPETQKLLGYRKLWDYMEQLPDHSKARTQVIGLIKDLRDNVRAK